MRPARLLKNPENADPELTAYAITDALFTPLMPLLARYMQEIYERGYSEGYAHCSPYGKCIYLEHERHIVGFIQYTYNEETTNVDIETVYVVPEWRFHGERYIERNRERWPMFSTVYDTLFKLLKQELWESDKPVYQIRTTVHTSNTAALRAMQRQNRVLDPFVDYVYTLNNPGKTDER